MGPEKFLSLIQYPHKITFGEVDALKKLLGQYPYFQLAYSLIAKAGYDADHTKAGPVIQLAAIYATNRNYLKRLLENKLSFTNPEPTNVPTPTPKKPKEAREKAEVQDVINGYINNIRKRAKKAITKQKSLAQRNIIEAFTHKNLQFNPTTLEDIPTEDLQANLAKQSTTFHDELITENLAQIMLKQGKVLEALEIYSKLMLKFPEKKAYFASLITELKNK